MFNSPHAKILAQHSPLPLGRAMPSSSVRDIVSPLPRASVKWFNRAACPAHPVLLQHNRITYVAHVRVCGFQPVKEALFLKSDRLVIAYTLVWQTEWRPRAMKILALSATR